ncbi:MAG TPA: PH domain-containing protein [Streptosporangiaceae bacterium]|nr:PH domain-containing protein [Streptosporangiaceae bacterium]
MTESMAADPLLPGLRAPGNRVSRRAVTYWTTRAALSGAIVVLAELGLAAASGFSPLWQAVVAASVFAFGAHAVIMPRWRYRVHRWEVTDHALYTRAGWFSVHWRIAPISRIQTIDSHRSVGERIFGLANVTATTASAAGPVRIHGLDRALADRLLDQLAVATGRASGDAT